MRIFKLALTGAVFLASSSVAIAQGLTIGAVQKQVPTSFCGVYLPNSEQPMVTLLTENSSKDALVNVDGQDLVVRQTNFRWTQAKKQSRAVYRGKNLTVTIEAQILSVDNNELETTYTMNRVTFKRGNLSKTIQSKGACAI